MKGFKVVRWFASKVYSKYIANELQKCTCLNVIIFSFGNVHISILLELCAHCNMCKDGENSSNMHKDERQVFFVVNRNVECSMKTSTEWLELCSFWTLWINDFLRFVALSLTLSN